MGRAFIAGRASESKSISSGTCCLFLIGYPEEPIVLRIQVAQEKVSVHLADLGGEVFVGIGFRHLWQCVRTRKELLNQVRKHVFRGVHDGVPKPTTTAVDKCIYYFRSQRDWYI